MGEKTLSEEALSYGWEQAKSRFWSVKYLIGCITYAAIVGIGFLLFIIPGIWLAIRLQYFAMFILDEDASAMESIKKSFEITKGNWFGCFVLVFEIGLMCGLGGLFAPGIGLLWFVPTALVAYGFAYMKMSGQLAPVEQSAAAAPA